MTDIKRKRDLLSKEARQKLIREIGTYFETERDLEIGVLAAEEILDFFLDALGEGIYIKAIDDVKQVIKQSLENIEVDLDLLINK